MVEVERLREESTITLLRALIGKVLGSGALEGGFVALIFFFVLSRAARQRKEVKGKLVLVTGAASGIGKQLSIQLAKKGARLALWDINGEGLQETAEEAKLFGAGEVETYKVDLSKRKQIYENAEEVLRRQGRVDVLVNNAGIISGQDLLETSDKKVELTFAINALSHIFMVKAFLPGMIANKSGHIMGVASMAGYFPSPRMTDYCATKFAARGFYEALDAELRSKSLENYIKVTLVAPAAVKTPLFKGFEQPFAMEPEYVAKQMLGAVEVPCFHLILPYAVNMGLISQTLLPRPLFQFFLSFSFSAMNSWNPTQANSVFDRIEKA